MKLIFTFLLFFNLFLCKNLSAQVNVQDSLALTDLYKSTNGDHWKNKTNWFVTSVDQWYGITVDKNTHRIVGISLGNNNLSGILPGSVGNCSALDTLLLEENKLTGSIPSSLGSLKSLEYLALGFNQFDQSSIPGLLKNLTSLIGLDLSHNKFNGSIPDFFESLTHLKYLDLSGNQLSGGIPVEMGMLASLGYLDISNNYLSGTIPDALLKVNSLKSFYIERNYFTFSAIEELVKSNLYDVGYYPQRNLVIHKKADVLYVSAGGAVGNNTYRWRQTNSIKDTTIAGDSVFAPLEAGSYVVSVTNSVVKDLTLYSDTVDASVSSAPSVDSITLVSIYRESNGDLWTNSTSWLTGEPLSAWFGVTVDKASKRVIALNLPDNHLTKKISSAIANLSKLEELNIAGNQLADTLPASMKRLHNLKKLDISNNKFSFESVEIATQTFSGALYWPQPGIVLHKKGAALSVSAGGTVNNNTYHWYKDKVLYKVLDGDSTFVPETIGNYHVLVSNSIAPKLTLYSDSIVADLTASALQDSLALVDLFLSTTTQYYRWFNRDNWLTNTPLSKWYGVTVDKVSGRVTELNLKDNNLNGAIPLSIGCLTKLQVLDLEKNNISGILPTSLGNLSSLITLNIGNSFQLYGDLPASIGNLSNLFNLNIYATNITGKIPSSFSKLNKLGKLNLWSNNIEGEIPDFLGNLQGLYNISLGINYLQGTIPSSLGNLGNLGVLDLSHNQLTGSIPASLGKLKSLQSLYLTNNQLTGNIPEELGNITLLNSLYLGYNQLTGSIPNSFRNFKGYPFFINLANNQLSGPIPLGFDSIPALGSVGLQNNRFTFSGMEELQLADKTPSLEYSPQAIIPIYYQNGKLFVSAGGKLSNNTYQWYRNSNKYATVTGDSTLQPAKSGIYKVAVTNAIATQLTLFSDSIAVGGSLTIAPARPAVIYANREYTNTDGWTDYFYNNNTPDDIGDDTLLLSLNKNGQDIGTIGDGTFAIKLAATQNAGSNRGIFLNNTLITNTSGYWVMNRYWQVTPTQQPYKSVGVKFYYNNQDLKDVNGSYPSHHLTNQQLIMYKAINGNPDPTTNLSGATKIISIMPGNMASDTTWTYHVLSDTTQYAEYSVSSFSGGGGGGTGNNRSLPVTLLNFAAYLNSGSALLNWQTAGEINSTHFNIQRSSNGSNFTTVGKVNAAGNSTLLLSYSFTDANVVKVYSGKIYYRLQQIDKDGTFKYSKTIALEIGTKAWNFVIAPNPVHDQLQLQLNNITSKATVTLFDLRGLKLQSKQISQRGDQKIYFGTASLAAGIYMVQVECEGQIRMQQFIKY